MTPLLIAVNIALLAWDAGQGAGWTGNGPSPVRDQLGFWAPLFQDGEWYRAIGYGFAHFGAIHLVLNMWGLWILGHVVEARFGSMAFVASYLAGIVGGAIGVVVLEPDTAVAGASGAIFALMGMIFVLQLTAGQRVFANGIGQLLVLNVAFSFSGFVSLGGHLGGLAAGLACGAILALLRARATDTLRYAALPVAVFAGVCWLALVPLVERAV